MVIDMLEKDAVAEALRNFYEGADQTEYQQGLDCYEILKIARAHRITPIVFSQFRDGFEAVLDAASYARLKREATVQIAVQMKNDAELIRACKKFSMADISYAVCKGATCRTLYKNAVLRTSCDEDILVEKSSLSKAVKLLASLGFKTVNSSENEVILTKNNLTIELKDRFCDYKKINELIFDDIGKFEVDYCGAGIRTLPPSTNFLMLSVHFYEHFIRGGIGLRQVMDLIKFADTYREQIDFEKVFDLLKMLSADKLIVNVLGIGNKFFDVGFAVGSDFELVDALIDDIMKAGAYGNNDPVREHSGTVTVSMVKGGGRMKSILSAALMPKERLLKRNSELDTSAKRAKYRAKRTIEFMKRKNKPEVLRLTLERESLLKKLGII